MRNLKDLLLESLEAQINEADNKNLQNMEEKIFWLNSEFPLLDYVGKEDEAAKIVSTKITQFIKEEFPEVESELEKIYKMLYDGYLKMYSQYIPLAAKARDIWNDPKADAFSDESLQLAQKVHKMESYIHDSLRKFIGDVFEYAVKISQQAEKDAEKDDKKQAA